jgi:hypothetical protein
LGGVGAYVVLSIGIVQSVVVLNSVPRWCQVLPHRIPFRSPSGYCVLEYAV